MPRWSTSPPGKSFRKPQKICTKNPQTPSVQSTLVDRPLLLIRPTQTRYCVKWKSSEAKLVLKITDNTTVSPPSHSRPLLVSCERTRSDVLRHPVSQVQNILLRLSQPIRGSEPHSHEEDAKPKTSRPLDVRHSRHRRRGGSRKGRRRIPPNAASPGWRREEKESKEEEIDPLLR